MIKTNSCFLFILFLFHFILVVVLCFILFWTSSRIILDLARMIIRHTCHYIDIITYTRRSNRHYILYLAHIVTQYFEYIYLSKTKKEQNKNVHFYKFNFDCIFYFCIVSDKNYQIWFAVVVVDGWLAGWLTYTCEIIAG